jgi:hypothetical protein
MQKVYLGVKKEVLQEDKVHPGVAEQVPDAGGYLGAEKEFFRAEAVHPGVAEQVGVIFGYCSMSLAAF